MDGAQRNDYYESLYPGLMTSSQALARSRAPLVPASPTSHRTMLKLAPPPETHLCARLLYLGLLLCLAATACAEHSTGKRYSAFP